MRVATLTFHWATNYGAVLQAYALQQFLARHGYDTEILDYSPRRARRLRTLQNLRSRDVRAFVREARLRGFRRRRLRLSARRYSSETDLLEAGGLYDAFVCGSDQIWNEWFSLHGEGGPTRSYFLGFVPSGGRRVAYAASFGTDAPTAGLTEVARPELAQFSAIGVREDSGARAVADMGLPGAVVVADPTLLLSRGDYDRLIAEVSPRRRYPLFAYLLHASQGSATAVVEAASRVLPAQRHVFRGGPIALPEWLFHLRHAELVITNSFHGAMMSLIFQRPFLVVPVEGAGSTMNGRILTLMRSVGLEERIVGADESARVEDLIKAQIDWDAVGAALDALRRRSEAFLLDALAETASDEPDPIAE